MGVTATDSSVQQKCLLQLLLLTLVVRIAWLIFVPVEIRSLDSQRFEIVYSELLAGRNPYQTTSYLNYAPFWIQIIWVLGRCADFTHIPLGRVLQAFFTLIDLLLVTTLFAWGVRYTTARRTRNVLVALIAFNPIAILLSLQHGHFDPLLALFIVLFLLRFTSFLTTGRNKDWYWSCLWLGLGIFLKTVPVVLLPLCAAAIPRLRGTILLRGAILIFAPVMIGLAIIYALSPQEVNDRVIMYTSVPGYFGVTGLLAWTGFSNLIPLYKNLFFALLLALLCFMTHIFRTRQVDSSAVIASALLLLGSIVAFGPGYGNQYFFWLLPVITMWLLQASAQQVAEVKSVGVLILIVVLATFISEYALQPHLGAFWRLIAGMDFQVSQRWIDPQQQTVLRLPLFFAYALLVGLAGREFFKAIRGR